ncbi:hypothetical protein D9615_000692 [Tricholomella constricta]|uniref:Eukaryotic translation initiation factor 3 subunit M n=1 Tax=Tricholomella constricta TaxID=117010 RepID=A0A8H5HRL2_9AGAR|nr:hypothetical protein D9615_000692 [Tricholomella constricta]
MAGADSVSVFAEGTFEEQVQELVNYIVRNRSEGERAEFIRPFQEALKTSEGQTPLEQDADRKRSIFQMVAVEVKSLGDGTDKEIEGFFNLLFSHLFSLHASEGSDTKVYVNAFVQLLTHQPSERKFIKYRILSNLFNAVERTSSLRPLVYIALVQMAGLNNDFDTLQITRANVEKWLSEWNIPQIEKAVFLKNVSDAYLTASQPANAYDYERLYIQTLPSSSSAAQDGAINLIATALRLPTVFDFDPLFKLDAVLAVKDHELFSLLQIFLNDGLLEFKTWEASHSEALEKHKLDRTQLERKIRLLTLASLAFQHIGRDLSYSKITDALQVNPDEVEKWAIDVIRAGLVWGKLSQTTHSLHVTRATARTFEKEQWEALEKRLQAWKSGLNGVLEVVVGAKRQVGLGQPQNAV